MPEENDVEENEKQDQKSSDSGDLEYEEEEEIKEQTKEEQEKEDEGVKLGSRKPKNQRSLKDRIKDKKEEDGVKKIGKDKLSFDGKRGYAQPSQTDVDTSNKRKEDKVDEITAERKEDLVDDIAGETKEEKEDIPPPPPPPSDLESDLAPEEKQEPEAEEQEEKMELEEVLSDDVERYEIKQQIPEVSGESAEFLAEEEEDEEDLEEEETDAPKRTSQELVHPKLFEKMNNRLERLSDKIDSFSERLDDYSDELTDLDEEMSLLTSRMEKVEDREVNYEKVEEKIKELSALYDLIASDVSPFMELDKDNSKNGENNHNGNPSNAEGAEKSQDLMDISRRFLSALRGNNSQNSSGDVKKASVPASRKVNSYPSAGIDNRKVSQESSIEKEAGEGNPAEEYDIEALMDWIEFLYRKSGGRIEDALDYYVELNWIDEDLKELVIEYTEGMKLELNDPSSDDEIIGEDGTVKQKGADWRLSPKEHKESLKYIKSIKRENGSNKNHDYSGRGET